MVSALFGSVDVTATSTVNRAYVSTVVLLALLNVVTPLSGEDVVPALSGYDPVAYFVARQPTRGSDALTLTWHGAVWKFTTAENLARFRADPDRYAPRFEGYCAWSVARGALVRGNPRVWEIVGDRLYLFGSHSVRRKWVEDSGGYIARGDERWPAVRPGSDGPRGTGR